MQPANPNSKSKVAPPPPVGKANRNLVRELISQSSQQKHQQNQAALLVDIETLRPNPDQPRRTTDPEQDAQLCEDIKIRGILEPLIVRPGSAGTTGSFEIVAGERRYRAAQAAGLRVVPVIVQELSDKDVQLISLAENLQRAELSPLDEARFFQKLAEQYNWSTRDIAKTINMSQSYVQKRFDLLKEGGEKPADVQSLTILSSIDEDDISEKGNNRIKSIRLSKNSQLDKGFSRISKLISQTDEAGLAELSKEEKLSLVEKIGALKEELDYLEQRLKLDVAQVTSGPKKHQHQG